MKGTIIKCLEELVRKHGDDKWHATLEKAGYAKTQLFSTLADVDDQKAVELITCAASALGVSVEAAMDAFGEHWCTVYAPGIYGVYFERAKSARELLLNLANIHVRMTATMKDAAPPHFDYDDAAPDALVMTYRSKRGLVALMPGLVKGVAKYYKEQVSVSVAGDRVTIQFLSAASRRKAA